MTIANASIWTGSEWRSIHFSGGGAWSDVKIADASLVFQGVVGQVDPTSFFRKIWDGSAWQPLDSVGPTGPHVAAYSFANAPLQASPWTLTLQVPEGIRDTDKIFMWCFSGYSYPDESFGFCVTDKPVLAEYFRQVVDDEAGVTIFQCSGAEVDFTEVVITPAGTNRDAKGLGACMVVVRNNGGFPIFDKFCITQYKGEGTTGDPYTFNNPNVPNMPAGYIAIGMTAVHKQSNTFSPRDAASNPWTQIAQISGTGTNQTSMALQSVVSDGSIPGNQSGHDFYSAVSGEAGMMSCWVEYS